MKNIRIKFESAACFFAVISLSFFSTAWSSEIAQQRAIWGSQVEFKLTSIFNNLQSNYICKEKPDFHCNGLMVSAFENSFEPYWMHSGLYGKLSFTYIRNDIGTYLFGPAGFILFPQFNLDNAKSKGIIHNAFNPQFRCAFPIDAETNVREDSGCGKFKLSQISDGTEPCQDIGIQTTEQWFGKYVIDGHPILRSCGFRLQGYNDKDKIKYFSSNIEIQKEIISLHPEKNDSWNEIVASTWPLDLPSEVPVIALFYVSDGSLSELVKKNNQYIKKISGAEALMLAQEQQNTYYQETGIFLPIVRISGDRTKVKFTYTDSEQVRDIPAKNVNVYPY